MDRQALIGNLKCRMCAVTYQMRANYLHEPVDVYCEWIDEATEKKDMMERKTAEETRDEGGTMRSRSQHTGENREFDLVSDVGSFADSPLAAA